MDAEASGDSDGGDSGDADDDDEYEYEYDEYDEYDDDDCDDDDDDDGVICRAFRLGGFRAGVPYLYAPTPPPHLKV